MPNKSRFQPPKIENKKKNFTFYISTETMEELIFFLEEFGFGESKGEFIEKAIRNEIVLRKKEIKKELENKLKKLNDS